MKKYIILLEDDHALAEVIKIVLAEAGYTCFVTDNTHSAIKMISMLFDIKLALVDYKLLEYETCVPFCSYLWAHRSDIPILLISASTFIKDHASEIKATDYIGKPFSIDELINKVNNLFKE